MLDIIFKEEIPHLRKGRRARNVAIVRHLTINLVRGAGENKSIKRTQKMRRLR